MEAARVWALRGTCQRKQVGVVIAYEGRILATGYNGAPKGLPHCEHNCICRPDGKLEVGLEHLITCALHPEAPVCRDAVHAEANAIAFAARYGIPLDHSTLYTTYSPCLACAQLVINAGIERVKCGQTYHDQAGMHLLIRAGLQVA